MKQIYPIIDRRKFLSLAVGGSTVAALPGITAGAGRRDIKDSDDFIKLIKRWKSEYGEVSDRDSRFISGNSPKRVIVSIEFESGEKKQILIAKDNDTIYISHKNKTFVINNPEKDLSELTGPRLMSKPPRLDPGGGGSRNPITINPGEAVTWNSADDSTTESDTNKVGQIDASANEFAYHAEARSEGLVATWGDATAEVYNSFQTGTDGSSPRTTVEAEVEYSLDGTVEVAGTGSADAEAIVTAFIRNTTQGEIVDEEILYQYSTIGPMDRDSVSRSNETETLQASVFAEQEYDVGVFISVGSIGYAFATAQANISSPGIEVNKIELDWV